MSGTSEGHQKYKAKMIAKLRMPLDDDVRAEQRYRDYMRDIGRKGHANPDRGRKSADTKLKNDPDYFKKLGRIKSKK